MKKYKKNIELFSEEIINWNGQTNLGAPYQFNRSNIKYKGIKTSFIDLLKNILTNLMVIFKKFHLKMI